MKAKPFITKSNKTNLDTLGITSEFSNETLTLNSIGKVGNVLEKRAKSKFLNCLLMTRLVSLNSPLKEKYWKTYYCSHVIETNDIISKSTYCSNRFCMICNRIRTAQLMLNYMPTLNTWSDKTFVTLTIPNVSSEDLNAALKKMYADFTKIKDSERKEGFKLVGLRKLECTYNVALDNYHPHYHIILENPKRNKKIIDRWLKLNPNANRSAQNFKKADEESCFELFKYFTKITSNSSKDKSITIQALDIIFNSITGVRTFQPFGFVAHKLNTPEEIEELNEKISDELKRYSYHKEVSNWLNHEDGDLLTNFNPNKYENLKSKIN